MISSRVPVIIGILAIVMGSAAVYGVLNVNTMTQAKSDQTSTPNYSSTLESLNSQVVTLNSQVNSLGSQIGSIDSQLNSTKNNPIDANRIQTDIADIHEKLVDLDNMKSTIDNIQTKLSDLGSNNQAQQTILSGAIAISLDKTSYVPGDTVHITGTGADPLKVVQVQLLDNNGVLVTSQNTWADSTGNVNTDLTLSNSLFPESYQIKLVSDQATGLRQFTVGTINTTPSGSYVFTAQTDKGIYESGDQIQVSGMTQPAAAVTAIMSSPSGKTFTSSTTANADGTYTILFSILSSFETGPWTIAANSISQSKSLSIYLESVGSSTLTLTAQTSQTTYNPGDSIQVYGTAQPNTSVSAIMTNPSGGTYSSSATASSGGSYTISFTTLSSYQSGTWSINVTNLNQNKIIYFTLGSSSSSYTFTAQTGQATYNIGDIVQVAGSAQPGVAVSESLVNPSGNTYSSSGTANSSGSYVLFFSTLPSYQTGTWNVIVTSQGQSKILSFTLQPAT